MESGGCLFVAALVGVVLGLQMGGGSGLVFGLVLFAIAAIIHAVCRLLDRRIR